ncbi:MAG: MraY family glycosyltransferase, partial [Acidobacteria bacterium]|nr:MraY family glycosyltransferase [Acidobacteriota bacterium]
AVAGGLAAGAGPAFALGAFPAVPGADGPGAALPFVAATAIVLAVGLLDDARGCSVGLKLGVETIASLLIVGAGHAVEVVSTPVGPVTLGKVAGSIVTVVWLVGITNAVNLMDGLDGLVGGVTSIIAGSLAVFAWLQGDPAALAVALILCGTCLGFLPWNWRPARIFLGDGGALTIGFVLAWLALIASLKAATAVTIMVPLLVLGVPAIDTLLVMAARYLESPARGFLFRVRGMVRADRRHLQHRILAVADQRTVVLVVYGLVCAFCLLSLLAVVRNSFLLAVVTLLVQIAVVALVRNLRGKRTGEEDAGARRADAALSFRR